MNSEPKAIIPKSFSVQGCELQNNWEKKSQENWDCECKYGTLQSPINLVKSESKD